jgi:hypothetical protein
MACIAESSCLASNGIDICYERRAVSVPVLSEFAGFVEEPLVN